MKKSIFLTACLFTALLQNTETAAQNNVIDEVVWVVGDEAIYKSEVEEAPTHKQKKLVPRIGILTKFNAAG